MAGIFAQTVTFATAGAGAGIADDMHKGLIDRFRSLPMARGAVLTGRTLADLVQTALTWWCSPSSPCWWAGGSTTDIG